MWMCIPAQPVKSEIGHQAVEFLETDRFYKIAVDMVVIGAHHVLFCVRGGQDDDRDVLGLIQFLDDAQDFESIHAGETQIEEDQMRTRA